MAEVTLDGVRKLFGSVTAVEDFTLSIGNGEFVVFVGPSGCGKSTTLRMLAGLEDVSSGSILIDGRAVNNIHPKDRDIAMVFQNYALFPHMTVAENLTFPLKVRKMSQGEIDEKVRRALDMVQMRGFADRKPAQLSGGQQQRVAIARALVHKPALVIADEPTASLDPDIGDYVRSYVQSYKSKNKVTILLASHNMAEVERLCDSIIMMKNGKIIDQGTSKEIINRHGRANLEETFLKIVRSKDEVA